MQAYLFDDFRVEIDERATVPGHCWHGQYRDGIPVKLTSDLERFFYKLTLGYENPVVLDIGANDGVFSLIAAINQHIRCFAFEPAPSNYDILQRNIALNNLEGRVKTFQLALADKKGTAVLKVPSSGKNDGLACIGSPLRFENWVECEVPVSTVDDFLKEYGLDRVDLVKIDTEGCELLVLKGAQELIRRCHPNILLEYWEPNTKQFGYRPEEITKLLASLGYKHTMVGHEDRYFYMPKVAPVVKPTFGTANIKTSPRRNSEPADIRRCVDIAPRKLSPTLETFCTSNEIDSVNEVGEWIEQLASSQKRLYYRLKDIKKYIAKEQGHISKQAQQRQLKGLTIFAMPKCFTGAFAAIQRNAVGSWMQLRPRPEIILLGDDDGVADFALRYGFKHIPSVQRNEFGTPLLDDLFLKAQAAASNEICVYVNSDIILMDDFAEALESVARRFDQFLMVGRRWDLDMSEEIDFYAEDWEQRLIERVRREGIYHAPTGIDYFAFKKGLWPAIPPLALGRGMWDNWLVREPLLAGQPVVDASDKVTIIHQNHGHSHISGGKEGASFNIELQRNLDLTGNDTSLAYTSHAAWELTPNGIALRPISEFLKENNFSTALKCIESAYQQAPDIVKEQFEALRLQVDRDCLSRLLPVARRELILGSAKNVAKLLLNSLETENRSAAEEFFRKGFQYLNDGNVSEAVKHLERAAMNCTTLPNLYYALAAAYAQLGDIFSAKRACQVELSLQPDNRGAAGLLERIDQAANEYRQSLIG